MLRRLVVTAAALFCAIGVLIGTGVIGTRVEESAGGALASDATLLAPAGPAFSIWSVIYLGLFGYTIWQWLPIAATPIARASGRLAGASLVLNGTWLLVTQRGWIWMSVLVILTLLGVLAAMLRELHLERLARPARTTGLARVAESMLLHGTFGLYLGWVAVAAGANIAAAATDSGLEAESIGAIVVALALVVAVTACGTLFARGFHGRAAVAAGMVWGLVWVAVARLGDEPYSVTVGGAAGAAAALVALAHVVARTRARRRPSI